MGTGSLVFTAYGLLEDIVSRVFHVVWEGLRLHCNGVFLGIGVFPTVSLGFCLIFGEGEVFLGYGFVVCKRREFRGEELSVSVCSSLLIYIGHIVHVLYDLRDERLIFFLSVLAVQDAVLLGTEAGTGE